MTRRTFIQAATAGIATMAQAQSTTRSIQTPVLDIAYEESGNPRTVFRSSCCTAFPTMLTPSISVAPPLAKRGLSRAGALFARLWTHALSRCVRASHGGAGGHRTGCDRFRRCSGAQANGACRIRLGRTRGGHRSGLASRARASHGAHRRLYHPECFRAATARATRSGTRVLVSVVLQYRARTSGTGSQSPQPVQASVADVVARLALQRRRV